MLHENVVAPAATSRLEPRLGHPVVLATAAVPTLIALHALFSITLRHALIGLGFVAVGSLLFLGLRWLGSADRSRA